MKSILAFACAALVVGPALVAPQTSFAQSYQTWNYDPCAAAKQRAANQGAVAGGVTGALLGSAIAGHDSRLGGAIVGGTIGAVAGHQIGKSSVRCVSYPPGYRPRAHCHWVENDYGGRRHEYEICRGADGVWRASGRRY
jgi:hypothetical protein